MWAISHCQRLVYEWWYLRNGECFWSNNERGTIWSSDEYIKCTSTLIIGYKMMNGASCNLWEQRIGRSTVLWWEYQHKWYDYQEASMRWSIHSKDSSQVAGEIWTTKSKLMKFMKFVYVASHWCQSYVILAMAKWLKGD